VTHNRRFGSRFHGGVYIEILYQLPRDYVLYAVFYLASCPSGSLISMRRSRIQLPSKCILQSFARLGARVTRWENFPLCTYLTIVYVRWAVFSKCGPNFRATFVSDTSYVCTYYVIRTKMGWATFWAIFSYTHLVTLLWTEERVSGACFLLGRLMLLFENNLFENWRCDIFYSEYIFTIL
jgi:hypothetical protein